MTELYSVSAYFLLPSPSFSHSFNHQYPKVILWVPRPHGLDTVLGSGDTLMNSQNLVNGNCNKVWFGIKGGQKTEMLSSSPLSPHPPLQETLGQSLSQLQHHA